MKLQFSKTQVQNHGNALSGPICSVKKGKENYSLFIVNVRSARIDQSYQFFCCSGETLRRLIVHFHLFRI